MTRGWTSRDLPVVGEDDTLWNVTDAAQHLGPLPCDPQGTPVTVTVAKLWDLSRLLLQPVGKRRSTPPGHPGRYARVYRASDFIGLYEQMEPKHPVAV